MALPDRVTISTVMARNYLRVDDADEDVLLEPMLEAALEEIEGVIGHDFTRVDPDTGETIVDPVPQKITIAALRMLGSLYEWRDTETSSEKLGDEQHYRRSPEEEREALAGYLWQYRKIPGLSSQGTN